MIKNCPICGTAPRLRARDMGKERGRGYPGHTNYQYSCPKCGMIQASADDVYSKDAPTKAISNWNAEVNKIEQYLAHEKPKPDYSLWFKEFKRKLLDIKLAQLDRIETMEQCEKALLDYMNKIKEKDAVDLYMIASLK